MFDWFARLAETVLVHREQHAPAVQTVDAIETARAGEKDPIVPENVPAAAVQESAPDAAT